MVCTQCRTSTTWRAQVWNMTALSAFPAGASQGAVGRRGAQGRWARQQCREESVGAGQAPSTPWGTRGQQASPFQLHHKATFFFFFCILCFFFLQLIYPRKKAKGDVFLEFSLLLLLLFWGVLCLFVVVCFIFPREKEEKGSFSKVLSLHAMGPGQTAAASTQIQVQVPAGLPAAILTGRSHNKPILGKGPLVDFQIVRDGREKRWVEGEPDPQEGWR